MIPAEYYKYIYLLIILLFSLGVFRRYSTYQMSRIGNIVVENQVPSILLCVFMALFIGLRPASAVFVDMAGYASQWHLWALSGTYTFQWGVENLLFDNIRIYMSTAQISYEWFFILISSIYFCCMYLACRRLFPKDTLFAFLVFLAAFSTFSYATNGIKAGSAASIFMLALAYHDKPIVTIVLSLASLGFHHSMVMVVVSYLIVYFYHRPKGFFALWVFSVIIAALHISVFQGLFSSMADESGADYLQMQTHGRGFRIDFILYSAMPVLVGYYAIYKKKIQSEPYYIVLCLYLMTNAIWMLCMYAEFTNRIAYLSWLQYPIVLIYPFVKEHWGVNQYLLVKKIAYGHLVFTLFMELVFYA